VALVTLIVAIGYFGYQIWPEPSEWHLQGNAEESFVHRLEQAPNQKTIEVTAVENNTKAENFAEDVRKALKLAKWNAPDNVSWMIGKADPGITIYYRDHDHPYHAVLEDAFRLAHWGSSSVYRPQEPTDLHIHIRDKP
jgi:hypothetical protein